MDNRLISEKAADAVAKYRNGDSISDDELVAGRQVLAYVLNFTDKLDQRFLLFNSELRHVADQFESFYRSRKQFDSVHGE